MINISDIEQLLAITPIKFSLIKRSYGLLCTYLDFKQKWDEVDNELLTYVVPLIIFLNKSFRLSYFGINVDNPTQSLIGRYFYIHFGLIRILQTIHPYKPGKSAIMPYLADLIINKMVDLMIKRDMILKLTNQKIDITLLGLL